MILKFAHCSYVTSKYNLREKYNTQVSLTFEVMSCIVVHSTLLNLSWLVSAMLLTVVTAAETTWDHDVCWQNWDSFVKCANDHWGCANVILSLFIFILNILLL